MSRKTAARWGGMVALTLTLTACSVRIFLEDRSPPERVHFSPNGAPLSGGPLGRPSCEQAMAAWFDRTDTGHRGRIDRAAFLADARAQFARMDLDHDGHITADELTSWRASLRAAPDTVPPAGGDRAGHRPGQPPNGDAAIPSGRDPVMSADANLDFKVSLDEFLTQANDIFARLDSGRGGLEREATIRTLCADESRATVRGHSPEPGGGGPGGGGSGGGR